MLATLWISSLKKAHFWPWRSRVAASRRKRSRSISSLVQVLEDRVLLAAGIADESLPGSEPVVDAVFGEEFANRVTIDSDNQRAPGGPTLSPKRVPGQILAINSTAESNDSDIRRNIPTMSSLDIRAVSRQNH